MSVVLNGNTYQASDFVGDDGRGYAEIFPATGLQLFPESIFTDLIAELASAETVLGVSPGAAGGILVSDGAAWIRAASATITSAGAATFTLLAVTGNVGIGQAAGSNALGVTETTTGTATVKFDHTHATDPFGQLINFSAGAPNDQDKYFHNCTDTSGPRFTVWSDGSVLSDLRTADTKHIELRSTGDVAHGMTTRADTATYGFIKKLANTSGGMNLSGFKDADGVAGDALYLAANLGEAADTTKSVAALGVLSLNSFVKTGTTSGAVGADGNLVVISNAGTARFIFDAEGDSHQDVGTAWTNFDDHDDVAVLNLLSAHVTRRNDPLRKGFGEWLNQDRALLEDMGLVTFNSDGHHFVNMSRLSMLQTGALRQIGGMVMGNTTALQEAQHRIEVLEAQLAEMN